MGRAHDTSPSLDGQTQRRWTRWGGRWRAGEPQAPPMQPGARGMARRCATRRKTAALTLRPRRKWNIDTWREYGLRTSPNVYDAFHVAALTALRCSEAEAWNHRAGGCSERR